MKTYVIALLVLRLTTTSYSQDKTKKDREEGIMKMEELPTAVIKSVGTDFSVYLPHNYPDKDVRRMEEKFIAYDIGKDFESAENYLLQMQTKDGSLAATYNDKGKLIRVVEEYKNVRLPNKVIYSIYRTFQGWTIVNDKYLYTQEEGDILKKTVQSQNKKSKTNS
jgi:hypothetical protein